MIVHKNYRSRCQLSWFALSRKATKHQQLNVCTDFVCWNWPTHAQNLFQNEALLCGSEFLLRRHFFLKIDWRFYKIWWCFTKFSKSMPAIVICNAPRGHKTSKTQCLHRLCVGIDPPTPKTLLQMRRCYSDLIVCSGQRFFAKSLQFVEQYGVFVVNR